MTNFWLLAQMKQSGRSILRDFDKNTFMDFLDKLLDRDNFNFLKEVDGRTLIARKWSYCFSYELELGKEAIKLCRESYIGIKEALWSVLRDTEHRMKRWLQLVAIPNAPDSTNKQQLTDLKKRMAALENRRGRSRSPRRAAAATTRPHGPLASRSSRAGFVLNSRQRRKEKGKGKKSTKGKGSGSGKPKKFADIQQEPVEDLAH